MAFFTIQCIMAVRIILNIRRGCINLKELDLSRNLFDLVTDYPEIKTIMAEIGFAAIEKPGMLQTAGRYMTIEKGARLKKLPLSQIVAAFEAAGFTVTGGK